MDKLNELSSSLLDLIPWHTREGLEKLVTEDNEQYRAIYDSITQQVDRINADILKSQQVLFLIQLFSVLLCIPSLLKWRYFLIRNRSA